MYRETQIKLKPGQPKELLKTKLEKKYSVNIKEWKIVRESLDARNKKDIRLVYTVDFECDRKLKLKEVSEFKYELPEQGAEELLHRPVIIGFGPCGMFAALILAEAGYSPLILERGKEMERRTADVDRFWKDGILDTESNVQFGEGGAGTFSDGKLTTGIKDFRIKKVLEEFVAAGAQPEILYKAKPHIGTDVLREVVVNIRNKIISLGGEIRFESRVTDFITDPQGRLAGVEVNGDEIINTQTVIAAPGHSARDTFAVMNGRGIPMEQKPFSIGVRVEHLQSMINESQYGSFADRLPAADYKLAYRCQNGRGVYTFCMCPGGEVVAAASSEGMTVTNGMSYAARDGKYANSALLVDVRTDDFDGDDVLAGVRFQEKYERLAFEFGGGYAPVQTTWGRFREDAVSAAAGNSENLNKVAKCLPDFVTEAYLEAMPALGRKLKGFDCDDTVMKAVETRSSSPVRIMRDDSMQSDVRGLYPAGEGAGYAGGITSAAVDGIKAAERIIQKYSKYVLTVK